MKLIYLANIRLPTEKAHGIQIMKMCEAFACSGVEVELVVSNRHSHIKDDPFEYYGIKNRFKLKRLFSFDTVSWGRIGFLLQTLSFSLSALFYALRTESDVVYCRDEIPLLFMAFSRRKLVWESHRGSYNLSVRLLKSRIGIVCISQGLLNYYEQLGFPRSHLCLAHDGYDPEAFRTSITKNESRMRLGIPEQGFFVFYIGLFDSWKGYELLLEASLALFQHKIEVVMIGGTEKDVARLKVKYPQVHFLGFIPYKELPWMQKAADVLVIPNSSRSRMSREFTSPLKLFAHMSSGVPIVASDLPSLREVLNDKKAILFTPDDKDSLIKAIVDSIRDHESALERARRAVTDVAIYSWKSRADLVTKFIKGNIY